MFEDEGAPEDSSSDAGDAVTAETTETDKTPL